MRTFLLPLFSLVLMFPQFYGRNWPMSNYTLSKRKDALFGRSLKLSLPDEELKDHTANSGARSVAHIFRRAIC